MPVRSDKMRLNAFLYPTGHHVAAWRHPDAKQYSDFSDYVELVTIAESGKMDSIFLADQPLAKLRNMTAASQRAHSGVVPFEPLTLLGSLAAVTRNIGLIATASSTFMEPYNLARQFASIDRLSNGRAGWNLVTTWEPDAAYNYNRDSALLHADRYEIAEEFADVVIGLWDSWKSDAFVRDRARGVYFEPDKLSILNHEGKHFKVRGPLNLPPSPQGRPVIVEAGASEPGQELAARTADVVFVAHPTLAEGVAFYRGLKDRMTKYNRRPESLAIMPGILPFVGRTQAEAEDKFAQLQALVQPDVGLDLLSTTMGVDMRTYDLDGPVPELPESNAGKSRQTLLVDLARKEGLTVRDLYLRIAGGRGHWQIIGTPAQIADAMQERFEQHAADGFNVMAPIMPSGLRDFVELVIPELRRRNLFRHEYEGKTLRENLGLD